MFSYFDEQYTVVDDTLLMYAGAETEVVIPKAIHGQRIRKIGDNAFLRNAQITSVEIEEGIEELGNILFINCGSLRKLVLPSTVRKIGILNRQQGIDEIIFRLKMSPEELMTLRESSFSTTSGKYMIPPACFPKDAAKKAAALEISLTPFTADNMPLFAEKKFLFSGSEEENLPQIWQKAGSEEVCTEREGVLRQIRLGAGAALSAEDEEDADWLRRNPKAMNDKRTFIEKQAAAWFTEKDITADGWSFDVNIHLTVAYYFRQRVQGVMIEKTYYVYSRYYAFPKGMYRVDMAVLNGEGDIVTDSKTSAAVYRKYKLPSVF